jgi:VWFA-related protein
MRSVTAIARSGDGARAACRHGPLLGAQIKDRKGSHVGSTEPDRAIRSYTMLAWTLGLVWNTFGIPCHAQAPRFSADVTNINVQVSVTEGGQVVAGLQSTDFVVRDEGEPQTIVAFGQESVPIRLILLIDMSGSIRGSIREMAEIAGAVLKQVHPQDRVGVMSFSIEGHLEQPLTADVDSAAQAIRRMANRGVLDVAGTRLIHPISSALGTLVTASAENRLEEASNRKAILIVTDNLPGVMVLPGEPVKRFEPIPDAPIIRELLAADTVLDAIVVYRQHVGTRLPPPRDDPRDPRYTQENAIHIARATGGEAIVSVRMKDSFSALLSRIRGRYSIWYRPPQRAEAGTFRRITVSLSDEALRRYPRATVRAREGYYVR